MRDPDLSGVARAWKIDPTEIIKDREDDPGLVTWLINGPYHPFWSWWMLAVVHLRDIPGILPPEKSYPEAEYELMILSLDPGTANIRKQPDIDLIEAGNLDEGMPGFLTPPDVVFQFHKVTEEQAIKIAEYAVQAIVNGRSCDSDFREWWKVSLSKTVEHIVLGVHD